MPGETKISYEFGQFRLDITERKFLKNGETIPLSPKAFDTLAALVRKHGRLVTKNEILKEVWQDTFVEESNLSNNIYLLRKALGEDASGRSYIENVPRHGYRFVGDVQEGTGAGSKLLLHQHTRARIIVEEEEPETGLEEVHSSHVELPLTSPSLSISAGRTQNRTRRYAIASLLLVTFVSFSYWWVLRKPGSFGDGVMFHSIAVLPFKPIGAESRDEHLGLGMTDATITKLSSLQQFTVRPTSAIFKYTEQDYEALKVGRELGVDAVLEGTVQRVGGGVRVSVQLISIREGKPIWAEKFDERFTDIFIIQDAISAQVAQALRLKLTRDERSRLAKRYTDNLAAYQSYVRGNYFWSKRTEEGIRKAIQYFKQAIDMDTNYALAYAGLGDAYGIVGYYGYENIMKRAEAYEEAKAIATKALRLDEMIPEAHVVLALVKSEHDKDDVGADREYKLALALNPDSALANHRYGVFLLERGRVNEASIVSRKASELDPLSSVICANYCATLYFKREYDAAVKCSNRTFEISPDMPQALLILGLSQGQLGRHEEAIEVLKRFSVSTVVRGDRIESLRSLGYVYALAGQRTAAQNILTELDELSQHNGEALFSKALIYAGLGEMVKVFTVLEKRAPYWTEEPGGLRIDPRYDRIKADPRYAQLLKRHFASL